MSADPCGGAGGAIGMSMRSYGKRALQRVGADTTRKTSGNASAAPRGRRAGELLAFIQSEVTRTGAFPSLPAMQAAMGLRCARSVEASLLRLLEGGFITREVIARKHTRRVFAYRLVVAEAENQQAPELNPQEFA